MTADDEETCAHPNGFGPGGCSGCGEFAPPEQLGNLAALQVLRAKLNTDRSDYWPSTADRPEAMTEAVEDVTSVEFDQWWSNLVAAEAPTIAAKAKEYGSNSLAEMGRLYARGQGREIDTVEALELGCAVYMYGKVQRIADSMIRGVAPSVDTLKDTMIYAAMSMFIRENRRWP